MNQDLHDEVHRAMCAHRNGLENYPIFAATMVRFIPYSISLIMFPLVFALVVPPPSLCLHPA